MHGPPVFSILVRRHAADIHVDDVVAAALQLAAQHHGHDLFRHGLRAAGKGPGMVRTAQ